MIKLDSIKSIMATHSGYVKLGQTASMKSCQAIGLFKLTDVDGTIHIADEYADAIQLVELSG